MKTSLTPQLQEYQKTNNFLFTLGHIRWGWKPPHFFQMQYSLLDGRTVPI